MLSFPRVFVLLLSLSLLTPQARGLPFPFDPTLTEVLTLAQKGVTGTPSSVISLTRTVVASNATTSTAAPSTAIPTVTLTVTATPGQTVTPAPPSNNTSTAQSIRVLPLGDSITFGIGTADRNSYRAFLQTRLAEDALDVIFLGSVKSGNMTNNDCEAQSGATIDQISTRAEQFLASLVQNSTQAQNASALPHVVTLVAGTNDVAASVDLANAPQRLISLTEKIHAVSPNTTILVGGIPPLAFPPGAVDTFNAAVQTAVQAGAAAGRKMAFVNMTAVTAGDLADGVHPNAAGYEKMSQAWVAGMVDVIGRGLIQP